MSHRIETDSIGELTIGKQVLYGINTQRALYNFPISGRFVNKELIYTLVIIKKAAAMTHKSLNLLPVEKADYIIEACEEILQGKYDQEFITDALQGGAGTSTNMNVNEVIANAAIIKAGGQPGNYSIISPLDDVNKSQSTNDVYPTALRIAAIRLVRILSDELALLQEALQKKEHAYSEVIKLGRTQLMDALPIMLGQEFGAYAQAIARDRWRIYKVEERLRQVNLGGTAVGTGMNASKKYSYMVVEILRELTGLGLARAEYPMDLTQNADVFTEVSGLLKSAAVNLIKISNDLRLMNSGPDGGFGEIRLEAVQAGSTIMPGKVNPVIPEMVAQASIKVIANDNAITQAAFLGQLELNPFLPLIADALLESLSLLINAVRVFKSRCIDTLKAEIATCFRHVSNSSVLATALIPYIGYDAAAKLAKEAQTSKISVLELARKYNLMSEEQLHKTLNLYAASTYLSE